MIQGRELHGLMEQTVDREVIDGAMVLTTKGSILTTAGFENVEAKVISAISANIWSHFLYLPTKNREMGDLRTLVFRAEYGVVGVAEVGPEYIVGLYSRRQAADFVARLAALRTQLLTTSSLKPFDETEAAAPMSAWLPADGDKAS
eukprot:CAMPEP_0197416024 /NCGR_PEP_ID=MMETSP1170-20131217/2428_1 /TAXON_ID=54406 /ORGANISM="Sarcinochrysis sp, Strain CCMP770" /LENGTH=145 /DNA_ID=CAMNT_0042942889 /DNA_START=42 /DNA_END=479 /DNA_ORIENTATION=+